MSSENIHSAIGELRGEMRALRAAQNAGNLKLDTLITQTVTLKAERAAEQRKYKTITTMLAAIGTFAGAVLAKMSGHI